MNAGANDWRRAFGWLVLAGALLWAALAYRSGYANHFAVLMDPGHPEWWNWSDQGRYHRAAEAWANWSLDPARHWYFAGYPLLGAALFNLAPGHPFYLVDLGCLLLFGATLALLAGRLAATPWLGRAIGAAAFLLTVVLTRYALKSFIEPWTTTPTAPLTIAALLLACRLWDCPTPGRAAGVGLATAAIVLFRPVDMIPVALAIAAASGIALWALPIRAKLRLAAAALAAAALPAALTVVTYLAVFGTTASLYLQQSGETGFEWRLIPLHWVTLMVSPLPEFRDEFSLSQNFPWIIPGVAGMLACLVTASGRARLRHAMVIAAVLLHILTYLAYRDLHPQGLFRFGNYHYVKWCLPVLGVYAVFLVTEIVRSARRWPAWGLAGTAVLLLFSWRMTWREMPAPWLASAQIEDGRTLVLPQAPRAVEEGLFVPASGGLAPIYLASYTMQVGGKLFKSNADFKAFPVEGGLIFTVLRPMPPGPAVIRFDEGVRLHPGPLRWLHAHLFWRWPHVVAVARTYIGRWAAVGDQ